MPAKLNIPKSERGLPNLQSGGRGIRGKNARKKALLEIENRYRNLEALMKTVLICGCLWGGFWTQFAVSVPFNMPSIHVLSGGRWYDPDIMFYRPSGGPLPFSIAGNFLLISVFGSLFAVVVAWLWTKEAGAKWRMRFAVWLFSAILVIWSVSGMLGEEAAWTAAENDRVEFREWLTRYPTDTYAKKRIEEIDRLLKLKPPSNHD